MNYGETHPRTLLPSQEDLKLRGMSAGRVWLNAVLIIVNPIAAMAILLNAPSVVNQLGGFEDLKSRLQLAQMNAALGYDDPNRYISILGPWIAVGGIIVALWALFILWKGANNEIAHEARADRRREIREIFEGAG